MKKYLAKQIYTFCRQHVFTSAQFTTGETDMDIEKCKKFARSILRYVIPYFVGILAALILTPADLSLVGRPLWYLYPIFAIPAFFLVFTLISFHSVSSVVFSLFYLGSVGCILFGIASHFGSLRRYRDLAPKLIGFSFGFFGTAGIYALAAASI